MKRIFILLVFTSVFALSTTHAHAQNQKSLITETEISEEDEGPTVLKFEPDFLDTNDERKAEMVRVRKIIDTLQVSERKRLKLIRDLYKVNRSNRLKKALLVDTKFEDIEE